MAQRYTHPLAIERMRANTCPECGGTAESHTNSVAFWIPRGNDCSLLPDGVADRIQQRRADDEEE